jgi:CDP-glucose 4,6-dehydratase
LNPAFWSGKRVLLTGHTGFKGAWASLWLARAGATVTGYALDPPTQPNLFGLARASELVTHLHGDVRDLGALQRAVAQAKPDVAIHMAAQSLVRLSYAKPEETYAVNVQGTVNFLEALRREPGARVALVVTSDKCYQNPGDGQAFREDGPLGGHDPYSNSKACAELATAAYRDSFFSAEAGPGLATVRAGNVVGGGDWAQDRLVPDLVRALSQGRVAQLRNPDSVRPWQHVLEPLSGYLLLAERLWDDRGLAGAWNFGPAQSDEQPVRWIAERLAQAWGAASAWERQPGEHPAEAQALRLDSGKARARLGWRPRWDLARALASISQWHRALLEGGDARSLVLQQIEAYEHS